MEVSGKWLLSVSERSLPSLPSALGALLRSGSRGSQLVTSEVQGQTAEE